MADNQFKIWASIEVDNKQIKTEFTKAWELAWDSLAQWLGNKEWDIQERIQWQIENLKWKLEELSNFDWDLNVNTDNAQEVINILWEEITDANRKVLELWDELKDMWEDWWEAFQQLQEDTQFFATTLWEVRDEIKSSMWDMSWWFDEVKEAVNRTADAVEELWKKAEETAWWDTKWLGKMLKFLSSKEIINFFYRNIKKIGEKLIELSWDAEMLANKFEPVKQKLEALWWYIWQWLTPALEWVIEDINVMTDELINAWWEWENSASKLQKWIYWVWVAIRWLIKLIKSLGTIIWAVIGWARPLIKWFFSDVYDTAKSVIEWIGNADNWIALWDNIKYWVLKWVNEAIDWINGMLKWLNDKLWVNLWKINTIWPWATKSFSFWDFEFSRTKEALNSFTESIKTTWNDAMDDIAEDWVDFIDDTKEGYKKLWNTVLDTNKKIKNDTQKTLWSKWGWWSKKDSVKWAFEELEEEAIDIWEELNKMVEEHQKNYDAIPEKVKKVQDSYQKLRDSAKETWEDAQKALEEYNNELEKSQADAITDLWQRYVQLKKELIGVDDYMKKRAENLSWKEISAYEEWWIEEYYWYKLKDLIELKEKLDEMKLIEENTTEEQRKSDEFIKETSKTQEILNKLKQQELEIEEKKTATLEKQAIAQSMIEQEDWKQYIKTLTKNWEDIWTYYYDTIDKIWKKIENESNVEYAKQLETQVENLNGQLEEYKNEKDAEVEILMRTTAKKIELENEFHNLFIENAKKQEKELDNLIAREQQLIDKRREYLSMWWTLHNAYGWSVLNWQASIVWENGPEQIIARQSSYIQPRNAGNSYNTVNNSSSLSINWIEIWNFNTVDDMLEALRERLTYRS